MMVNLDNNPPAYQVTALATGCSLVLYDGSPLHPHTAVMWDLVDRSRYPQNSHQFDPNYIEVIVDDNIDDHQVWESTNRCGITVFGTSAKWIAVQVLVIGGPHCIGGHWWSSLMVIGGPYWPEVFIIIIISVVERFSHLVVLRRSAG